MQSSEIDTISVAHIESDDEQPQIEGPSFADWENIEWDPKNLEKNEQTVEEAWICLVCNNLVREPPALQCPHLFCALCLTKTFLGKSDDYRKCPCCRMIVSNPLPQPNMYVMHKIAQLRLHCENKENGCLNVCTIGTAGFQYQRHLKECLFSDVVCPDCKVSLLKRDLQTHTQECPRRPKPCLYCGDIIPSIDMNKHLQETLCVNTMFCPNRCKVSNRPSRQEQNHQLSISSPAVVPSASMSSVTMGIIVSPQHISDSTVNSQTTSGKRSMPASIGGSTSDDSKLTIIYKRDLKEHLTQCRSQYTTCPIEACNIPIKRKKLYQHIQENYKDHFCQFLCAWERNARRTEAQNQALVLSSACPAATEFTIPHFTENIRQLQASKGGLLTSREEIWSSPPVYCPLACICVLYAEPMAADEIQASPASQVSQASQGLANDALHGVNVSALAQAARPAVAPTAALTSSSLSSSNVSSSLSSTNVNSSPSSSTLLNSQKLEFLFGLKWLTPNNTTKQCRYSVTAIKTEDSIRTANAGWFKSGTISNAPLSIILGSLDSLVHDSMFTPNKDELTFGFMFHPERWMQDTIRLANCFSHDEHSNVLVQDLTESDNDDDEDFEEGEHLEIGLDVELLHHDHHHHHDDDHEHHHHHLEEDEISHSSSDPEAHNARILNRMARLRAQRARRVRH